ncbi:hypothetical protein Lfu02_28960 [Longispora fulva]|uniref:DUF4365 domain-containing protein n=1 Tax=Longispora fulva TaxID=619741 RepID=A0A8J7GJ25_9ACTN|nr:DUF4365 domain-containing protein [Longispora fulva]MBG6139031.1 hypothetical protein [Longispora fulva]GIG58524.1 hypothetical protein Lfu02_28960 [Longispora fulva]
MRSATGLNPQMRQGYYGEAFVRVLAAASGLVVARMEVDVTGEDFIIGYPGRRNAVRYPKIEVQVKSWSVPKGNDNAWRFRMRAEHFNELAGTEFYVPRFLFLIVVPPDEDSYARADRDALRLHHAGYWASFRNQIPVTDAGSVTVDVPKDNLLTAHSIHHLFPASPVVMPLQRRSL